MYEQNIYCLQGAKLLLLASYIFKFLKIVPICSWTKYHRYVYLVQCDVFFSILGLALLWFSIRCNTFSLHKMLKMHKTEYRYYMNMILLLQYKRWLWWIHLQFNVTLILALAVMSSHQCPRDKGWQGYIKSTS